MEGINLVFLVVVIDFEVVVFFLKEEKGIVYSG